MPHISRIISFNYNALNNPGAAFTAFRCIPSQYYSLVLDSYVTPGAGAINYTWQDDGAGNLCQLLSMCDSNKQKWLAKYSALYAADSKGFDALFSQCGAGVAGMTGSPLISASQLNSTCQQLNAYTPSTTFSSGCCESWVYTQLFPGANLPAGYPPLSICPTNSALKTSCPSPSTFYGLPNTNSSLLQACDS